MRFQLFFYCILFLAGCSSNEVVVRKLAVEIPGRIDTVEAEEYKLKVEDEEIGYRGTIYKAGSKRDTALVAEFIPAKKQFIIKRFPVKDTVYITDTLRLKPTDVLLRGNDNTERLIWIILFALTSFIIIIYKGYSNVRKPKKQA